MTIGTDNSRKVRRVGRQRGILLLLFLVFAASGALRLGTMTPAWASAGGGEDAEGDAGMDGPAQCATTASLETALGLVYGRAEGLDAREEALADRAQALDVAEALVTERLATLEAAEARLEDLLALSDSAAETDLERLTRVYDTMDPEAAAALFEQMEPSFAAGFLSRMRPETGAALLAELPPQTAYSISVILATRNAAAPRAETPPDPVDDTEN